MLDEKAEENEEEEVKEEAEENEEEEVKEEAVGKELEEQINDLDLVMQYLRNAKNVLMKYRNKDVDISFWVEMLIHDFDSLIDNIQEIINELVETP